MARRLVTSDQTNRLVTAAEDRGDGREDAEQRSLIEAIDAEMAGRQRGYATVRGELLFRARDEIERLNALVSRLESEANLIGSACDKIRVNLASEIHQGLAREAELRATVSRLEETIRADGEALKFYADKDNWADYWRDAMAAAFDRNCGSELGNDEGDQARARLSARQEGGGETSLRSVPTAQSQQPATPDPGAGG